MKYDWITIAMENGGVLTVEKDDGDFVARMNWENDKCIFSYFCETLPEALTSLNKKLWDDAADECEC
jgi:hypothetical protein